MIPLGGASVWSRAARLGVSPTAEICSGALSPIIPGDGGLHLFQIVERKQAPPAPELVRQALRISLREGRIIETYE